MTTILEDIRSLRLPGMAKCWQSLEETRRVDSLTLNEGLRLLLQSEAECRQASRTKRLIHNAKFRYQASVAEIYFDQAKGRDKDRLMELATCDYIRRGMSVLITGSTGSGKSYIASALGYQACLCGMKVLYFNMAKLLERLQLARIDSTISKLFDRLADTDLLIIDDFGMRVLDGKQLLDFMEIIEDRHGRKSTIISSQLPVKSWWDVLEKNATVADALLDRLVNTSYRFELTGESLRK
ncbi:MAG: IS21-like element helper ATPase IstB [Bacteroidales bacterium]|nr:IS21-like element helper ATPase IstB [Clostridiales bacterium]MCC8174805.1 IS21-like element helper ATPase IstB [Bacteroidales bacterium]MCD8394959.1 IS21-like element helper ATPase IstB [Bacteroidales bacterium]